MTNCAMNSNCSAWPKTSICKSRFLTPDFRETRISVWLHDVGSRSATIVTETLLEEGRAIFGPSYSLTPTGSFYQMNQDSNRLVADMVKSFSLSIGLVLLSILILLRSLRLTLLAMIPNVIPILWTLGLMGFLRNRSEHWYGDDRRRGHRSCG